MKRALAFAGIGLMALAVQPLSATNDTSTNSASFPPDLDLDRERAAIAQFQALDQRLQDIGWKLVRGNAEFCAEAIPSIGLQLQDLASYGRPDIARAALTLTGDFAVQTAASASPAGRSGNFPANREIVRVQDANPNDWEAGEQLYWQRLTRTHDHIDAVLAQTGSISFGFADGSGVSLTPELACATRFELAGSGKRAVADGARVVIGIEFEGFGYPEELLAAVVAHELAHNLLKHRVWLDRNKRTRKHVRATEREADRMMPWLLANAGYDPAAASRFFSRYQPSSGSVLFLRGSHAKWKDRVKTVDAELPRIRKLMQRHGKADWSRAFKREIDPAKGL